MVAGCCWPSWSEEEAVNLGEAQQEFYARGVDYIDDVDRLTLWLNQAKNIFEDTFPFPWLMQFVTGLSPLTISDLKDILYVFDANTNNELIGVPVQQLVVNGDTTGSGLPTNWWLDGNVLTTWPTATTVSARYVKESPELVQPSDTPLIPARYHNTWIDLAMIRAYVDRDNFVAAQGLQQLVNTDLTLIVQRYATRNMQNPAYQTMRAGAEDW